MVIYKTTNTINNRHYVGKDTHNDPSYLGSGKLLQNAILKYGKENFKKEILEHCTEDTIDDREIYWIDKLRTKKSYNIANGGEGGDVFTYNPNKEEIRKKNSDWHKENNNMFKPDVRKKHLKIVQSKEHREKMTEATNKFKDNPEYRKKLSEGVKKHLQDPNNLKKWSECKRGSLNGRWLGYLKATDIAGNSVHYETAKQAGQILGTSAHSLREHCRNKTTYKRGPYKGWKFEFTKR